MSGNTDRPLFIDLHNAVVRRAGRSILSVDHFSLPEGQSIALLGPNGSGKTTFVNLITREVFPLYREDPPVLFRGKALPTLQEVRDCLGIVSASMQKQIAVHLPAQEVVVGGLFGSLGVPQRFTVTDRERDIALAAMEELGIEELAERDIMTLSSGQARRVLIARALVNEPEVLIFDEPCTGLDPEGMYYVRRNMRTLAQHGKAFILVTHYPEDIIPEIERLVLLKDAEIFDDGPKEAMLTDERMSSLFDIPLHVTHDGEYYSLMARY